MDTQDLKRSADLDGGPDVLAKMAKKYDDKIKETRTARAAKGLPTPGPNPNEDTDYELTVIGEKVK